VSTLNTYLAGRDTYVDQATPNRNFGTLPKMHVAATASAIKNGFLWFARPIPNNSLVINGSLLLRLKGAGWAGGPHTITVKRITAPWKENTVTYNAQPTVTATNQATLAVTAGVDGQLVTIDIKNMLGDVAASGAWYGVQITVNTTGTKTFHASESAIRAYRPRLNVTYNLPPDPPDKLFPDTGVGIAATKPILKWEFSTPTDDEDQASSQVQISTDPTFASTFYDSGIVANTATHWDTSLTAMGALTDNTVYYWRVLVRDSQAAQSGWSDVATFTRRSAGVLTITVPAADGTSISDTTPSITHTFTGRTQQSARYRLYNLEADGSWTLIFTRPRAVDAALVYTFPIGYVAVLGETYKVQLDVWDDQTRPEDEYVRQERTMIFDGNAGVTAPTALVATIVGPHVHLTWQRATTPDFWGIWVDDVMIPDGDVLGSDYFVSGTTFAADIWVAKAGAVRTIKVRAKTTGTGYSTSISATVTPDAAGIWLVDTDTGVEVQILGKDEATTTLDEDLNVINVLNSPEPIFLYGQIRGLVGSVSGLLVADDTVTAATWRARFEQFKSKRRKSSTVRLIYGRRNIPVRIGIATIDEWSEKTEVYKVSFPFWQTGEFLAET
jgi:hypothetical protein